MPWTAISTISSVVATTLVVVAAWTALRQFKESLATRQLQGILGFIEQLQSTSVRSTRRLLRRHRTEISEILAGSHWSERLDAFLRENGNATGGAASLSELHRDLAALEFVAVLSLHGKIPVGLERTYLAPTIISYWEAIEPVVRATRAAAGVFRPIYLQHFESLVRLAASGDLYSRRVEAIKSREIDRLTKQSKIATSVAASLTKRAARGGSDAAGNVDATRERDTVAQDQQSAAHEGTEPPPG